MSKLPQVTHTQHERTVDTIHYHVEQIWPKTLACAWQSASPSPVSQTNVDIHFVITSTDVVRRTFTRTLFKVNSNDFAGFLFAGHSCNACNKHGKHVKLISWRITSSEPLLQVWFYAQ